MKFKISEIQANPFRHIDRYPIRRDKVAALRESLRTTGFWDNVVARVVNGTPQIAYGHHRLFALREEYAPDHEVGLIVRDLPDDQMLKIMARENLEEWGTSAAVEHETVRAVVEAYAAGKISLPTLPPLARGVRYAPSYTTGSANRLADQSVKPYTAGGIADFLGWTEPGGKPQDKVQWALSALEFIEAGILTEAHFDGLSTMQAHAVITQARLAKQERDTRAQFEHQQAAEAERQAAEAERRRQDAEEDRQRREAQAAQARDSAERRRREEQARQAREAAQRAEASRQQAELRRQQAEAREREERERGRQQATAIGHHVGQAMRSGEGYKRAAEIANEKRDKHQGPPPEINKHALDLAQRLNKILDADFDDRARDLERVLSYRAHLTDATRRELDIVLGRVIERAAAFRKKLAVTPLDGDVIEADVISEIEEGRELTS